MPENDYAIKCGSLTIGPAQAARFWSKVQKLPVTDPTAVPGSAENPCWEWTANLSGTGYGQFNLDPINRSVRTHRIAYALGKEDPQALDVAILCGNKTCCNFGHMVAGSRQQSIARRKTKRGSELPQTKISDQKKGEALAIKESGGSYGAIATAIGCSRARAFQIVSEMEKNKCR